jgi:hypothetical protein
MQSGDEVGVGFFVEVSDELAFIAFTDRVNVETTLAVTLVIPVPFLSERRLHKQLHQRVEELAVIHNQPF